MSHSPAIHIHDGDPLVWRAGPRARHVIAEVGLEPRQIGLLPGAAGGPKALALTGLDQAVFGDWLPRQPRLRHLIGSSIGGWRFACAMQPDPVKSLARLAERYTAETYAKNASAETIAQACREMVANLFDDAPERLFANEHYALTLTTVRARGLLASEARPAQLAGIIAAAATNMLSRNWYARHWHRVWFSDRRHGAPALAGDFPTHVVALNEDNLGDALQATAAIPLVIAGVSNPAHAPAGVYRDGGLIDYHMDLPYAGLDDLVFYPHFYPYMVPGWFDKALRWRRPQAGRLDNVVMVAPSPKWVARLPHGKIPDRGDFKQFDDAARQRYWKQVTAETQRLGDAFLDAIERQDLPARLQPL